MVKREVVGRKIKTKKGRGEKKMDIIT